MLRAVLTIVVFSFFSVPHVLGQYPETQESVNQSIECSASASALLDSSFSGTEVITIGTKKILVILVSAPGAPDHPYLPIDEISDFKNDLEEYFSSMSNGLFTLEVEVLVKNPAPTPLGVELFSLPVPFDPATYTSHFRSILIAADSLYDFNNIDLYPQPDGLADHVCIVVAKMDSTNDKKLWGAASLINYETNDVSIYTGNPIKIIDDMNHNHSATNNNYYERFAILQHELSHSLFTLPDIEHGFMVDSTWYAGGAFDGSIGFRFGRYPAYWNPYFRIKLGWLPNIMTVQSTQTLNLIDFEAGSGFTIYAIKNPNVSSQQFLLAYYNAQNYDDNRFLEMLPVREIDEKKGVLIWRHQHILDPVYRFLDKRNANISIESASGRWEWSSINIGDPKKQKFRKINHEGRFIPNILSGFDSLAQRGSFTWYNSNDEEESTYEDKRIGSFPNYFRLNNTQDFSIFSNPSSNWSGTRLSYTGPYYSSGIALKNFRFENGSALVDVKVGPEAGIVDRSSTVKFEVVDVHTPIYVRGEGTVLQFLPGSLLNFKNSSSIYIESGATLIADSVTFDFISPNNKNGIFVLNGGSLVLKNSRILNSDKAIRALSADSILIINDSIISRNGAIEIFNSGSTVVRIENNTIKQLNSYDYALVASGSNGRSRISITGNTFESGNGVILHYFGEATFAKNSLEGISLHGSTGLNVQNIPDISIFKNSINRYGTGVNLASGTFASMRHNKIFDNNGYGLNINSGSHASMVNGYQSEQTVYFPYKGCNECYNNGQNPLEYSQIAEIRIGQGSLLSLNENSVSGFNSIYDANSQNSTTDALIFLDAQDSNLVTLSAMNTYWGGIVPSDRFISTNNNFMVNYDGVRFNPFTYLECNPNAINEHELIIIDAASNPVDTVYGRPSELIVFQSTLDSLYALAEAYMVSRDYEEAKELYTYITQEYSTDPRVIEAIHRLLDIFNKMNSLIENAQLYQSLVSDSSIAGLTEHTGLYLHRLNISSNIFLGNYLDAQNYLNDIITNSSNSIEIINAELEQILLDLLIQSANQNRVMEQSEVLNSSLQMVNAVSEKIQNYSMLRSDENQKVQFSYASPAKFSLYQNYPNPFNPSTTIRFSVPVPAFVKLRIYDLLGREIEMLVNEQKAPGEYQVDFNAKGYSSGIYFYELQINHHRSIKTMQVLK
ncbi:MAG: hypothetical protein FMNOHCHN_03090 [Ignavibacteriaceae bacterium]|nr:hypothetical protein [Ignavibacteriaceae bacterium]